MRRRRGVVRETVAQVLREAGLRVVWNGHPHRAIQAIPLDWRLRLRTEE